MLTREINVELVKRVGDLVQQVASSKYAGSESKASLLKSVVQAVKVLRLSMDKDTFPDHDYAHEKALQVAAHAKECLGVKTGMDPDFDQNRHWMEQSYASLVDVVPGCK